MVLICILAHNNLPLTKACIQSCLPQDYGDGKQCSLIIIDNASTDNTLRWLMTQRGLSTISFGERLSVAACWNHILDWALSPLNPNHYEGVLMLNNDTEIRPDTVKWLMKDDALFTTCVSVRTEKEMGNFIGPPLPSSRRPHPDFSCFLIKPECWRRVGRFDECFEGAYCEDSSYHVRMHMKGITAICTGVPFLHHGSGTINSATAGEKRRIERAAERNRKIFEEMYGCLPGSVAYNNIFKI